MQGHRAVWEDTNLNFSRFWQTRHLTAQLPFLWDQRLQLRIGFGLYQHCRCGDLVASLLNARPCPVSSYGVRRRLSIREWDILMQRHHTAPLGGALTELVMSKGEIEKEMKDGNGYRCGMAK